MDGLSVTATTPGFLVAPDLVLSSQVMNEASRYRFYINVNYPVEANCFLNITFPEGLPLTTDLKGVVGTGMFSKTISFNRIDLSRNSVLLAGCPSRNSYSLGTSYIELTNIINPDYVKLPGYFKFDLYTVVNKTTYPIAKSVWDVSQYPFKI